MAPIGKILICLCGGFTLCATAQAAAKASGTGPAPGDPYQAIVDRNVFNLRTNDPAGDKGNEPPKPPPPKITLTGISTILGRKLALMKVMVPAKPGEPGHEESYMLSEGQRDGDVEVLKIDEVAGTVKVDNQGIVQILDFINNSAMPVNGGAPPGRGGNNPRPGLPTPSLLRQIPTRTLRLPSIPPNPPPGDPGPSAQAPPAAPVNNFPQYGTPPPPEHPPTAEEQTLLLEANRAAMLDAGDPVAKLMPRTDLTSQVTGQPEQPEQPEAAQ